MERLEIEYDPRRPVCEGGEAAARVAEQLMFPADRDLMQNLSSEVLLAEAVVSCTRTLAFLRGEQARLEDRPRLIRANAALQEEILSLKNSLAEAEHNLRALATATKRSSADLKMKEAEAVERSRLAEAALAEETHRRVSTEMELGLARTELNALRTPGSEAYALLEKKVVGDFVTSPRYQIKMAEYFQAGFIHFRRLLRGQFWPLEPPVDLKALDISREETVLDPGCISEEEEGGEAGSSVPLASGGAEVGNQRA